MAYSVYMVSRLSQFGKTSIDFAFVDDAGVMPPRRGSYNFNSISPTAPQITAAGQQIKQQITQEYTDSENDKADLSAFKVWLDNKMDTRIQTAQDQIQALVAASSLTAKQKAIANKIVIRWEIV